MPGTITPRPISAPEPNHAGMLGATLRASEPPTIITTKMATAEATMMAQCSGLRPCLPAVRNSEGKVPITKPMNRQMNCASKRPKAASTTIENSRIPMPAPMPTGMK
ncbi:Uncharacterised protein [Mycobacteroides abscessus subsp. abscessus]|nr:Uncharacterised protein [Mycobacteroides abscessus subsp. abscessus]